jgi:phenylpyruvate tautomerase PptA (4-oxalocrotonate tautomerase family)
MVKSRNVVFLIFVMTMAVYSGWAAQSNAYFIEAGGVVSMEAEHFTANSGYIVSSANTVTNSEGYPLDTSGYSGTGFLITPGANAKADYQIMFTNTGTYYVNLRSIANIDALGGGEENGFRAMFDGALLVCTANGCGMNVAKWARWAWVTRQQWPVEPLLRGPVTFNVTTPGIHTFSILPREPHAWFDKIVLQRSPLSCGNADYQGCLSGTGPAESQRSEDPTNPPVATTGTATSVVSDGATLNGTVNPNDSSTTVVFEYGETSSYGSTVTATQSPLAGTTTQAVSATITGLNPQTTYHFRVKATSSGGTGTGNDATFVTGDRVTPPTAATGMATTVSATGAVLNGIVNPNDSSTTVVFEYGETSSYGSTVTATQSPLTGTNSQTVSAQVSSLVAGSNYHFRVAATNGGGTANGDDHTFQTNGNVVTIENTTFKAGTEYEYTAATSITIGSGVTVESGAKLTLKAPAVTGKSNMVVEEGAEVTILPLP